MRLTEIHTTLDTRGQFVPMPVVRSEPAMRQVPAGGILEVVKMVTSTGSMCARADGPREDLPGR